MPDVPNDKEKPHNPDGPGKPDIPDMPGKPGAPGSPEKPDSPDTPGSTDHPDSPNKPGKPKPPVKPLPPQSEKPGSDQGDSREGDTPEPEQDKETPKPPSQGPSSLANPDDAKPKPPTKPDAPAKPDAPSKPDMPSKPDSSKPKPEHPAPQAKEPSRPSGSSHGGGSSSGSSSSGSSGHSVAPSRPNKPQASTTISVVIPAPDAPSQSAPISAQPPATPSTPAMTSPDVNTAQASLGDFTVRHPALLAITVTQPHGSDSGAQVAKGASSSYTPTPVTPAQAGVVNHGHAQLVKSRQQPVTSTRITQWLDAVQEDLHRRASGQSPVHTLWSEGPGEQPILGNTWTIKPGDTAWSLARALWGEDVSWSVMESTWITLVAWNPVLADAVPHHLPEGVTIVIPADIQPTTDA